MRTAGTDIVDAQGRAVRLVSVNWFGFETPDCVLHGTWSISVAEGLDAAQRMGFNSLRIPYSNQCLEPSARVAGYVSHNNPNLTGKHPLDALDFVISEAGKRNMKVILDRHRPSSSGQSELWYTTQYPESRWISDWKMLAARYKNNATVIGADLHNEPHGPACWGCGDPARDWPAAAERAGNAILSVNPNWLIVVEGVERSPDGSTTWWGGGLAGVRNRPVQLNTANRLVYSPHDYPATVWPQQWFSAPNYPANLDAVWDKNWGFIEREGIAPVWVGEFGTLHQTASDRQWLDRLVAYMIRNRIDGAFWSLNPNSGDTGGVLAHDWKTFEQAKLNALRPWMTAATPAPAPPPTTTTTTTMVPPPSTTTTTIPAPPTPPQPGGPLSAEWLLRSSWGTGFVADIEVSAPDGASGWTLSWPHPTELVSVWGMTCTSAPTETVCVPVDWAAQLPTGAKVTVGLHGGGSPPGSPPTLTITSP